MYSPSSLVLMLKLNSPLLLLFLLELLPLTTSCIVVAGSVSPLIVYLSSVSVSGSWVLNSTGSRLPGYKDSAHHQG